MGIVILPYSISTVAYNETTNLFANKTYCNPLLTSRSQLFSCIIELKLIFKSIQRVKPYSFTDCFLFHS